MDVILCERFERGEPGQREIEWEIKHGGKVWRIDNSAPIGDRIAELAAELGATVEGITWGLHGRAVARITLKKES